MFDLPILPGVLNHPGSLRFSLGPEPELLASWHEEILLPDFGGRKLRAAWVKLSTAEVLRLRATSPVSRYKSVRRFAQDDEPVERTNGTETSGGL